ncbi:MAG: hypothetical protein FIB08_10590 [Candidatus Methanoperedens sp.]|nr:hypothetical protein [Candidatus Methanoperedens sp.]
MKISYILAMLVILMIAGISTAGATPGQTLACNTAGCHAYPPTTINITTDVTSTLTVNPGQAFKVNMTWSGGNPEDRTEVNWPTDFSSIGLTRDNLLFRATPRIPASMEATPSGTANSTLTAPTVPGNYTVRVYASRGASTAGTNASDTNASDTNASDTNASVPKETDFKDINITVQASPAGANAPNITASPATSMVSDTPGATRTFGITANQTVNVTWSINGSQVQSDMGVTESNYTNTSAVQGTWNVTAVASNANGTATQAWTWNVSPATQAGGLPSIISISPTPPVPATPTVTDTVGATRTFSITVNQTVNVTWLINGTQVLSDTNVAASSYTNTSAAQGTWNVTAVANNTNGEVSQMWNWIVQPGTPGTGTIVVTPATTSVFSGDVVNFTASDQSGNPINATITWSSSNTTVGSIDTATGVFTAIAPGNTTVSATSGNLTGTANVTVLSTTPVPGTGTIIVTPAATSVLSGDIVNFTASDQSGNPINATITWSSSNTTVGTINATNETTGIFTALAPGNTTISATSGNLTGTANVTVLSTTPVPGVNTIVVTPATTSVLSGATVNFIATPMDQSGNPVNATITWSSSDTTVGTINATNETTGMFTALAPGNTTISATSGNITGTANVTVLSTAVTALELKPNATAALKGSMITITITALSGTNPQTLHSGTANITIAADNVSAVTSSPMNVSFTNGVATMTITSSIAQLVDVTATSGNITGNTTIMFADRVFPLEKGWNLVSIPNNARSNNVSEVLQNVQYNAVFSYDPVNASFSTPTIIQPLFGYWINVTATNQSLGFIADTTVVSSPPQRNLYEGWNLIGVNANRDDNPEANITAGDLFAGLEDNQVGKYYSILISYENVTNPQTFTGAGLTNSTALKQGHGYWLFIDPLFNRPQNNVPWAGTGKPW